MSPRQDRNRENNLFTQNISAVLILNTWSSKTLGFNNKPILTDFNGRAINCPAFTIANDVEVNTSCAVTYKGRFYVYGGWKNKRLIAKVTDKALTNVGSLPFDFLWGGCSSTSDKIILCFHFLNPYISNKFWVDMKTCYKTTNPIAQFEETRKSIKEHRSIKFASSECKFLYKH